MFIVILQLWRNAACEFQSPPQIIKDKGSEVWKGLWVLEWEK